MAILNRKLWEMGSHLGPEAVTDTGVHLGCGNGGAGGNLVNGGVGGRPSLSWMTSRLAAAILDAMVSGWRPPVLQRALHRGGHLGSGGHMIVAAILTPVDI